MAMMYTKKREKETPRSTRFPFRMSLIGGYHLCGGENRYSGPDWPAYTGASREEEHNNSTPDSAEGVKKISCNSRSHGLCMDLGREHLPDKHIRYLLGGMDRHIETGLVIPVPFIFQVNHEIGIHELDYP